ncbi:hypothetical protein K457DRAFT_143562 [Linnemannia elongata AG-77]|uniref:Uncharacterized protein n=1 Tax=Linnemannia elongata AG-77 TaxID=1314771 RepID=A0A197JCF9_9FUNG|nr:hypothetical protein K457DRAFT_143562 [Linnemannia elongata AG-77]
MTSTRSSYGTKRPAQAPNSDPIHVSESDDSEHEDCLNHEADETVCYTQQPLEADEDAQSPAPALPHAPAVSSAPVPSAPAPSSASVQPANAPATTEDWWTSLQQEQLVVYTQQQQELFAQAARVTEKLAACTSQEEYDQLVLVMRNLNQREQELRYMLEARHAWDSHVRMLEQRLTYLTSRAQGHP